MHAAGLSAMGTSTSGYPRAVLFDLDGTLVDTAPDIHAALGLVCARHGLTTPDAKSCRKRVSCGAGALIEAIPEIGGQDREALLGELLSLYRASLSRHSRLFPGMQQVLDWLADEHIPWGLVTNKPRHLSEPLLVELGLDSQCAVLVCPDELSAGKPDPEGILLACCRLGSPPRRTLYLGDHRRDMEAARAAGCKALAALYGYLDDMAAPHQWPADAWITSPRAFLDWLRQARQRQGPPDVSAFPPPAEDMLHV